MSKLFVEPNALRLESVLNELVQAFNQRRLSILNRYGVNEQDVEIIRYLDETDLKKMKEIGEHFNIKLSTLTSTIDKLEKNKLVKRKNSKEDRRVIYIRPTSRGQNLLVDLSEMMKSLSEAMKTESKPDDFVSMLGGLEKILEFIKSH
ncbi:MAG: MarR family transcriptional regulator [Bacteroidia bacterium]|nr:MarR family transcriptional regulator [Bacteroidia bacterium]